jgi:choline dehydrogenase-like flavoprotein
MARWPATPGKPATSEKVDVVIVGSGASGSVLAAKLAQAGRSVKILEGGPEWKLTDLVSNQIWARRLKWGGSAPGVMSGGDVPIAIAFNSGWGTGGAALHHYAVWLRLHEEDFQLKSRFGVGQDWPIANDDLRPYYDRIQSEAGIAGDAEAEVWRPAGEPYPMPPVPLFKQGEAITKGFDAIGLRTSPIPLAVTTEEFNGRPACIWDGWCDAGCPIGALANPLVVYLPQALAAGAVIEHDSYVSRVLTDDTGTRATGVDVIGPNGETRVQEADVVVLAAFAIQNPRILLSSATGRHPDGLANSSGQVGVNVMSHVAQTVFGLFPDETDNYMGATGGQLLSQEGYAKDPARGYVGGWSWLIANALKPNDLLGIGNSRVDIAGPPLHEFMTNATKRLGVMVYAGEDLPNPDNRLTLSPDATDRFGLPVATLTHAFGADDLAALEEGSKQGQEVFTAAGATEVWLGALATMHVMGGVAMGDDAAMSVVNSYGQTHEVPNLFVAGTSLFPTSGAVNPTFTVHALGLRSAEYSGQEWAALAG